MRALFMVVAAMLVGAGTADFFGNIDMPAARACARHTNSSACASDAKCAPSSNGCTSFTPSATTPAWSWTAYKDNSAAGGPTENATELMALMTGSGPPKSECGDNATEAYWVMADPINGGPIRFNGAKAHAKIIKASFSSFSEVDDDDAAILVVGYELDNDSAGSYTFDGIFGLGVVCTYPARTTIRRYGNSSTHSTMEMMTFDLDMFPLARNWVTTNAAAARQRRVTSKRVFVAEFNTPPTAPLTGNEVVHVAVDDDAIGGDILSDIARNGNRLKIGNVEVAVNMAETFIMSETKVGRAIQMASGAWIRPTVASCPCAYNIVTDNNNRPKCTPCPPGQINGGKGACIDPGVFESCEFGAAVPTASTQPAYCEDLAVCAPKEKKSCDLETLGIFSPSADVRTGSPSCSEDYWVLHIEGIDFRFKRGGSGECGDENGVATLDAAFADDGQGFYLTRNTALKGTSALDYDCGKMKNLVDDDGNDFAPLPASEDMIYANYMFPQGGYNFSRISSEYLPPAFEASAEKFLTNIAEYFPDANKPRESFKPARARRNDPNDLHLKRLRLTSSETIVMSGSRQADYYDDGIEFAVRVDTWFAPPWMDPHNPTGAVCALVVTPGPGQQPRIMMNEYFPNLIKCSTATRWSGHVKLVHSEDAAHDGHIEWGWIILAVAIGGVVFLGIGFGIQLYKNRGKSSDKLAVPFL